MQTHIVFLDSGRSDALGKDHSPSVHLVPNEDLGRRLAIFLADLDDLGVFHEERLTRLGPRAIRRTQGAVCLKDYALILHMLKERLLVEVDVTFALQGSRLDAAVGDNL